MATYNFAARNSRKAFAAGDLTLTVADNEPVNVYGIVLSNPTGSATTFTIANGSGTTLIVIDLDANGAYNESAPWVADAGLRITGEAGTYATVYHSNPGI